MLPSNICLERALWICLYDLAMPIYIVLEPLNPLIHIAGGKITSFIDRYIYIEMFIDIYSDN